MYKSDTNVEFLIELHNLRYVIDEKLGLWIKFEAKRVKISADYPHGIKYSFTLHDRFNKRIMGFDNAHAIEYGGKKNVAPKRKFYHWHRDESDKGRPYNYENAGKRLEDFWKEVEKVMKKLEGIQ